MSSFSEEQHVLQSLKESPFPNCIENHTCILKSKENIFKPKCNKALKRKLKKYRLRRDGKEDPDIVDVSKTLVSSLKIKSPNIQDTSKLSNSESEKTKPKNYLFKMVRKKSSCSNYNSENQISKITNTETNQETMSDMDSNAVKQMNAFKLMMESRNKSIGNNSPGKEKSFNEHEEIENSKRKEIKAKRVLVLEKMAEKKGYVKNQEDEDYRSECIKKKLDKRAKRLKQMITSNNCKKTKVMNVDNTNVASKEYTDDVKEIDKATPTRSSGKLQLFNFLSDDDELCESQNKIKISQEDEEFLTKLSPSIRKKENMLSYFKKVTKDTLDQDIDTLNKSEESVIKVKFTPKNRKKVKKTHNVQDLIDPVVDDIGSTNLVNIKTPTRKRKRDKTTLINISQVEDTQIVSGIDNYNGRPKRSLRKPLKYSNEISYSSSDEELHIITPKKKKNLSKKSNLTSIQTNEVKRDTEPTIGIENKTKKTSNLQNTSKSKSKQTKCTDKKIIHKSNKKDIISLNSKPVKLAPIFSTKTKLTLEEQEARQQFLKSGVPDKLKVKQSQCNDVRSWNNFYTVCHIQQKLSESTKSQHKTLMDIEHHKKVDWVQMAGINIENMPKIDYDCLIKLLNVTPTINVNKPYLVNKPETLLKFIKKLYLKFPVYRTYHLLKTKKQGERVDSNLLELDNSVEIIKDISEINNDNPDKLNWNEKYKPMSSNQIIGNFESVKELKRWLESWNENLVKTKKNGNYESDLSDFCMTDSETDSRDGFKQTDNVLIISGQSGTGKTSCVYAVAAELAIKVIEVNASSKRTGKIMLQDLQEATQSHKVNRGNHKIDSGQNSQEGKVQPTSRIVKKHGRPKRTYEKHCKSKEISKVNTLSQLSQPTSQESTRTGMSLILIDDADIIFDQDDGFCSAVSQLIHSSKRPVILVTSSLTCPHLQKYISCGKIIKMLPFLPRMLGTWLDIMCLADTNSCYPGLGCKLLDFFRGDIRKTINFLQFYMTSEKSLNQIEDAQDCNDYKVDINDENSSMSWMDQDDVHKNNATKENEVDGIELQEIIDRQMMFLHPDLSVDLLNIWWNMSNQFDSKKLESVINISNTHGVIDLNVASKILDNLSIIDCLNSKKNTNAFNLMSRPWLSAEVSSVTEKEHLEYYNVLNETQNDISINLIERTVSMIKNWKHSPKYPPSMFEQREKNRIVSQHNNLSSYLNSSASLDRRALALDYWSSCRTICRLEKNKPDNTKRNNRFCHYLKTLNILCKNDYFDGLSESLSLK